MNGKCRVASLALLAALCLILANAQYARAQAAAAGGQDPGAQAEDRTGPTASRRTSTGR